MGIRHFATESGDGCYCLREGVFRLGWPWTVGSCSTKSVSMGQDWE
jgi:hypothetical protein